MLAAKRQMSAENKQTNGPGTNNGRPLSNYNYDEAVQRVQQWNEALKSPSKPPAPKANRMRSPSPTPASKRGDAGSALTWRLASPPPRARSSSAGMANLPFIPNLVQLANPAPAVARPVVVPETEEATDNWDDDFEEDITLTKLQMLEKTVPIPDPTPVASAAGTPTPAALKPTQARLAVPSATSGVFSRKNTPTKQAAPFKSPGSAEVATPDAEDLNLRTIRPTPTQSPTLSSKSLSSSSKSAQILVPPVPPLPKPLPTPETQNKRLPGSPSMDAIDEDYDDLLADEDDLFGKVESFKV